MGSVPKLLGSEGLVGQCARTLSEHFSHIAPFINDMTHKTVLCLQVVERAFALLLQRFPRIQKLNQATLAKKVKIVMASCMLHNICILEKDNINFYLNRARQVKEKLTFKVTHNILHCMELNKYKNYLPYLLFQIPVRALNQQYRPLGTAMSSQLGILKRLQMANDIFRT